MNDDVWRDIWASGPDVERIVHEERTLRWRAIERAVLQRFGSFDGLRVIEIGSGHGTNALHFARRGALVTVLDSERRALDGAQVAAEALGVEISVIEADLFSPDAAVLGAFDVSCSFGLCEHFLDAERTAVIASHLAYLAPGGIALVGVPNRWGWPYRAWMGALKRRGSWPFGTEVPFSRRELGAQVRRAGGRVLTTHYGSFPATVVNYLVSPLFHKAGRRGFLPAEWRTPLDHMAYELLAVIEPASTST